MPSRFTFIFILLLFAGCTKVFAQHSVTGKVVDASDGSPLPFVTLGIKGTNAGTSTDIDGKFKLSSSAPITQLVVSYVGYQPLTYSVTDGKTIVIRLEKKIVELGEVKILPGENPAHRIIRLATRNRSANNPANIPAYVCETYSKTFYDLVLNSDAARTHADSMRMDSLRLGLQILSDSAHVLMMESVAERKYLRPGHLNEKIVATKVSGFDNPTFSTSAINLQPFSFYEDYFKILNKDYLNPLAEGSTSKYFFSLEDTLYQGNDSVFIISYRPLKGKNFDALKGLLYINTHGYAVQNVIASPADITIIDVKVRQQYSLIDNRQWFPEQLIYELWYKKYPSQYMGMRLTGKSYIRDVNLDTTFRKRSFSYATVYTAPNATRKDSTYWNSARSESLDHKERKTYHIIDSIGHAMNFDRKLKIVEALFTYQLPVSVISFDLDKVVKFNVYEQVRLGLGIHTNDRLSPWFSVGGYVGYGIRDGTWKYGGYARLNLQRNSKDYYIKYAYSNDLAEPAKAQYIYPRFNSIRNTMIARMDRVEQHELSVNFRAFKYLTASVAFNQNSHLAKYQYSYLMAPADSALAPNNRFKSTEIRLSGRYAYQEKLIQSFGQLLSDGSNYPVLYFSYIKGFKTPGYGDYDYDKLSVGIEKSFLIRNAGKTKVLAEGGFVSGQVPYPYLFNGNGSYTKDGYIFVENTFQTMGLYEFVSDRYASIFISHHFAAPLFKREKSQPRLVLCTAAGYGSLGNNARHYGLGFKTMEKGFYESGILINDVIRANYLDLFYLGLGGGVFMRYGPYAYSHTQDNLAYKLSLTVSF